MTTFRITTVKDYGLFWSTVEEKEKEASEDNLPLIVIVRSSPQPDGKCWCRDCGLLDKMLHEKLGSMNINAHVVVGEVGTLDEWLDEHNPFKRDKTLSLAQIPTIYRWKNGKVARRMEAPDILKPEKFKTLFLN